MGSTERRERIEEPFRAELARMRDDLARARFGSFLIVPLKYGEDRVNESWLAETGELQPITTMDVSEAVKDNLNPPGVTVLRRYYFSGDSLREQLFGGAVSAETPFYVCDKESGAEPGEGDHFRFWSAYLYIFNTQVAFLCLGITYSSIEVIERICNLGYTDSRARYLYRDGAEWRDFSLDETLRAFCGRAGLESFFQSGPLSLESYTYTLAVTPRRFAYLETMRQLTFNLHQMIPLGEDMEDASEEDVSYSYSVRSRELDSYRWGCCVTSQTISYVVANAELDLDGELRDQAEDGLPIVLLALYEKYSCLRFAQLLATVDKKDLRMLRKLNRQMLEFRAYGTVHPSHISRWFNVRQIYQHLVETNGTEAAIEDLRDKLGILEAHQKEREAALRDTIMGLITVFGVVSILASLLTILQVLSGGDPLAWIITLTALALIVGGTVVAVLWNKNE